MLKNSDPHSSARATIAFLIVVIAFAILFVFETNKQNILLPENFNPFIFFTFLGFCLLLSLMYLVNKPGGKIAAKSRSRKRRR